MTDTDQLNFLEDMVKKAKRLGATDAVASLARSSKLAANVRLGQKESINDSDTSKYNLTVYVGKKKKTTPVASLRRSVLEDQLARAVAAAKTLPDNPYAGMATPDQIARVFPDLDLFDPTIPSAQQLADLALAAEAEAMAQPGIVNADGSGASWIKATGAIVASNGFSTTYTETYSGLSTTVVARRESDGHQETDFYNSSSARFLADLKDPLVLGREAGHITAAKLDTGKIQTGQVPLFFHSRVAGSLLDIFADAINGQAIATGQSFLLDTLGRQIFSSNVTITDDPLMLRGLSSSSFDGDLLPRAPLVLVENGVLKSWTTNLESARQLKISPTGHAGGLSNLFMSAGPDSPEKMLKDAGTGFLVMEMMGSGVNPVTGDFSQAASGFWIENGERAFWVGEATVAGNLKDMFKSITPASDLNRKERSLAAPMLRVDGMTLAV